MCTPRSEGGNSLKGNEGKPPVLVPPQFITLQIGVMQKTYSGATTTARARIRTINKECFEHPSWRELNPKAPTEGLVQVSARKLKPLPRS